MNIWFTSDHHFGHKNILEYEKEARPFSCLEEMHEILIERWNSVVKPNDIVWHLGDFAFGVNNIRIAERLQGHKKLILGNHDIYPISEYARYFEKIYGVFHYKECVLSHIPIHLDSLAQRSWLNIHGHLHSNRVKTPVLGWHELQTESHPLPILVRKPFDDEFEEDRNYYNVSVEQNGLTPINFDIIKFRIDELKE